MEPIAPHPETETLMRNYLAMCMKGRLDDFIQAETGASAADWVESNQCRFFSSQNDEADIQVFGETAMLECDFGGIRITASFRVTVDNEFILDGHYKYETKPIAGINRTPAQIVDATEFECDSWFAKGDADELHKAVTYVHDEGRSGFLIKKFRSDRDYAE